MLSSIFNLSKKNSFRSSLYKNVYCLAHSAARIINMASMKVRILPALSDNYMYLVIDKESNEAAVIDPVEPESVLKAVKEEGVNLTKALITHHHWDHSGGNQKLLDKKKVDIYGGDKRVEAVSHIVKDGDKLSIGNLSVDCLSTPCHTTGHICYLISSPAESPALFTGDTIFVSGCGRFFEGNADNMFNITERLKTLSDDVKIFCGHEYTTTNLKFAKTVEDGNKDIQKKLDWALDLRSRNEPTVPSTIGDEKKCNPFMRVNEPSILNKYNTDDPVVAMKLLRAAKDKF